MKILEQLPVVLGLDNLVVDPVVPREELYTKVVVPNLVDSKLVLAKVTVDTRVVPVPGVVLTVVPKTIYLYSMKQDHVYLEQYKKKISIHSARSHSLALQMLQWFSFVLFIKEAKYYKYSATNQHAYCASIQLYNSPRFYLFTVQSSRST